MAPVDLSWGTLKSVVEKGGRGERKVGEKNDQPSASRASGKTISSDAPTRMRTRSPLSEMSLMESLEERDIVLQMEAVG